jgi:hypothetical protein
MLTPIGIAPNLPSMQDRELVPAVDLAVSVPASVAGQWSATGTLMGTVVRVQSDEMVFKVQDHFFTTRPIPGVVENYQLSLQVSQAGGQTMLVPLLPLAGQVVARATGAPSSVLLEDAPTIAPALVQNTVPKPEQVMRHLANRLDVPGAIADWLHNAALDAAPAVATQQRMGVPTTIDEWVALLTQSLSQSGLFYEAQLAAKNTIPVNDLKRQLLGVINRPLSKPAAREDGDLTRQETIREDALSALDDLTNLQGAAVVAHRLGGACFSFVLPAPDQQGSWWMTITLDPPQAQTVRAKQQKSDTEEQAAEEQTTPRWQVKLGGIDLPFGDLDIRIDQYQHQSLAVTLVTPDDNQAKRLASHRSELADSLEQAGLALSQFAVLDRREDRRANTDTAAPPPGQVTWVSV